MMKNRGEPKKVLKNHRTGISGGGKTSVQLFDMMGRQVFESQVDDITRPFSITIPAEQTSRTPFITRVRDKNGSVVKKNIVFRM